MIIRLLLLYFSWTVLSTCSNININGICIDDSLHFNRVDFTNDIHKHIAIKMHGYSSESVEMNVMILFRSPIHQMEAEQSSLSYYIQNHTSNRYHNAMFIGGHSYHQYFKITKDSQFVYDNEIPIISRAYITMIPYTVIYDKTYWNKLTKNTFVSTDSGNILSDIMGFDDLIND